MKLWFAVFLGLVQGITEFLPVSSSGHLSILQNVFGMENAEQGHLFFDVLLHLGTLISIFIVYRRDILALLREFFGAFGRLARHEPAIDSRPAARLILMIVAGTLPLVAAVLVKDAVEKLYYSLAFIGFALIVTGILLYVSDKLVTGRKTEKNATVSNALVVGLFQAVAIIPGLSRSGSTITAGLFQGFDREFAVKFSFLLSIPAIIGANILSLIDAIRAGIDLSLLPIYLAGVAAAAISGCGAIWIVKFISKKEKFGCFAYYCWVVGLAVIVLSFIL